MFRKRGFSKGEFSSTDVIDPFSRDAHLIQRDAIKLRLFYLLFIGTEGASIKTRYVVPQSSSVTIVNSWRYKQDEGERLVLAGKRLKPEGDKQEGLNTPYPHYGSRQTKHAIIMQDTRCVVYRHQYHDQFVLSACKTGPGAGRNIPIINIKNTYSYSRLKHMYKSFITVSPPSH